MPEYFSIKEKNNSEFDLILFFYLLKNNFSTLLGFFIAGLLISILYIYEYNNKSYDHKMYIFKNDKGFTELS